MTKLTRKLMISVFTLAFALITLGASTFAWFTLTSTASVNKINMQVVAGEGIQISGDGINYRNVLPLNEILDQISQNSLETTEKMDALTTSDGRNFKYLDGTPATNGYIEFNLYFRSPKKDSAIHFNGLTKISSTPKTWISDAGFKYRSDGVTESNTGISIYAADALRFSFEEYDDSFENPVASTMKIFELDPVEEGRTDGSNYRLDDVIKTDKGLVKYWEAKNGGVTVPGIDEADIPASINSELATGTVEVDPENNIFVPKTLLLRTSKGDGTDGYYYNYAKIRMWLEGWDPDNFDALLNANFNIVFSFAVLPAVTVSDDLKVSVTAPGGISDEEDNELAIGTKLQFTKNILPAVSYQDVKWSVTGDGDAARINSVTGELTVIGAGEVTVIATSLVDLTKNGEFTFIIKNPANTED